MKTKSKILLLLIGLTVAFFSVDYGMRDHQPLEVATVVHKTFAPPGNYHPVKNPAPKYVIVAIQSIRQQGYWIEVSQQEFYQLQDGDKIPLSKDYGFLTGWEYHQKVFLSPEDDLLPPQNWIPNYSEQ